jgi:hypothetical protein
MADSVNPQNTILGGATGLTASATPLTQVLTVTSNEQGVYAEFPASQLKYNNSNGDASIASQARLFINVQGDPSQLYPQLFGAIKSPDAQPMLLALMGTDNGLGSATGGTGYVDFLLSEVEERRDERYQISEVLSDDFVTYVFGQHAPIWSFSGWLFNTKQDDWAAAFDILYDNVLRASKMADIQQTLRLRYDNKVVTGTMINVGKSMRAEMQMAYNFSFQMIVTQVDVTLQPTWQPTQLNTGFTAGLTGVSVIQPPQLVPMTLSAAMGVPPRLAPNAAQDNNEPPADETTGQQMDDWTYTPVPESDPSAQDYTSGN